MSEIDKEIARCRRLSASFATLVLVALVVLVVCLACEASGVRWMVTTPEAVALSVGLVLFYVLVWFGAWLWFA